MYDEELEQRYTEFKVKVERIRHNLNYCEQQLDRWEEMDRAKTGFPRLRMRDVFSWRLFA